MVKLASGRASVRSMNPRVSAAIELFIASVNSGNTVGFFSRLMSVPIPSHCEMSSTMPAWPPFMASMRSTSFPRAAGSSSFPLVTAASNALSGGAFQREKASVSASSPGVRGTTPLRLSWGSPSSVRKSALGERSRADTTP